SDTCASMTSAGCRFARSSRSACLFLTYSAVLPGGGAKRIALPRSLVMYTGAAWAGSWVARFAAIRTARNGIRASLCPCVQHRNPAPLFRRPLILSAVDHAGRQCCHVSRSAENPGGAQKTHADAPFFSVARLFDAGPGRR